MKHATGIMRPMLLLDDGQRYFKCRNEGCLRARQWLHEKEFYRLANPKSACQRASECRQCSNARRARQKWADRQAVEVVA